MRPRGDPELTVVLVAGDGRRALVRVQAPRLDLQLVDDLLRLRLRARRHGWALHLVDPPAELTGLLELTGLGCVLSVEPCRQPELGEQLRVQEVVQAGDPLA